MSSMSASDPYADLDALIRRHFDRPEVAAQTTAEMLAARRAAENPTPPPATVIPIPDFPALGVARYHCQRRCGWWHDEPTDPGPLGVILSQYEADRIDSAREFGADLAEMLSLNAAARSLAYQARVEAAITAHYAQAH